MQTMGKIARVLPADPEKVLKAKNQLLSDFSDLIADAEQLLASTASYSGETLTGARTKFRDTLDQFKTKAAQAQSTAMRQVDNATAVTQEFARENPWKVAGVAALAGALLSALLMSNRR